MFIRILLISYFCMFVTNVCFAFSENDLENLEISKYGKIYSNEDYSTRLRRLETDLLGMTQSGNIDKRINILKEINSNSKVASYMYSDDFEMQPKNQGKVKNFLNNISSSMFDSGMVTGFTPPITSSYPNRFFNNEFMNFANDPYCYCPYNKGRIKNRYRTRHNHFRKHVNNNNFMGNTGFSSMPNFNNNWNRQHLHRHYPNTQYYGGYPYVPTDSMTNVSTRSTVHILQD